MNTYHYVIYRKSRFAGRWHYSKLVTMMQTGDNEEFLATLLRWNSELLGNTPEERLYLPATPEQIAENKQNIGAREELHPDPDSPFAKADCSATSSKALVWRFWS